MYVCRSLFLSPARSFSLALSLSFSRSLALALSRSISLFLSLFHARSLSVCVCMCGCVSRCLFLCLALSFLSLSLSLFSVMEAVNASLEKRCTPALCMSLVNEYRKWETSFYKNDFFTFGDNGDDRFLFLSIGYCVRCLFLSIGCTDVEGRRRRVRAAELRLCAGACGYYFHQRCVHSTPLVSDA